MKASTETARGGARYRARLAGASALALLLSALGLALPGAALAIGGPPIVSESSVSTVGVSEATVQATLDPNLKETTYFFQYLTQAAYEANGESFDGAQATPARKITEAEGLDEAHVVSATIEGLAPGTLYRARLYAENIKGKAEEGEALFFGTYSQAPAGLADSRAYEQASPVDKNGGDAIGLVPFVKAALNGNAISFASSAGMPGGVGAQELPIYLASREGEGDAAHWQTKGLLPPAELGDKARILGWTPDFARVFQETTAFGEAKTRAMFERSRESGESSPITGYLPTSSFAYAGSSEDESTTILESAYGELDPAKAGTEEHSNVYARDGSGAHLASVLPDGESPPLGAFAGPYDWAVGRLNEGGAAQQYYTQEERAVSADGSLFFTTAGDGHVYRRRNPTADQDCASSTGACTIDVSPSRRTPPDQGGSRPRAFMGASADGKTAFFTSPEELTNDANTGPEVEGPKIGRATIGAPPEEEAEDALEELLTDHHAVGIATAGESAVAGEYVYWADPTLGTIGRAKLDGTEANDEYVDPGETCAETHPETEPEVEHCAPTTPRYVALGPCAEEGGAIIAGVECVYWTNTGPLGGDLNKKQRELPVIGAGTIGRAVLGAEEGEEVEPECVKGASDPQGIAVNESHIYWANSLKIEARTEVDIARAALDCSEAEQRFHELAFVPYGVALSATRVYWTMEIGGYGRVDSIPLGGLEEGEEEYVVVGLNAKPRGLTLIGPRVYWAAQGKEAIGRVDLELKEESLEPEFLKLKGLPSGLATEGSHLYWSANGEIPPHPGNDLYRFEEQGTGGCEEPEGCLTDLTADGADPNGAEVKGVLGISEDGGRLYFVANADLDGAGPAEAGNCGGIDIFGRGRCNLYAWEAGGGPAGSVSFVARLDAGGEHGVSDEVDWLPTIESKLLDEQKGSQLTADGQTLLFRSQEKLTDYENQGKPELYRYRLGQGITCVSCNPTGLPPSGKPSLGSIKPSLLRVAYTSATASRNLSANGRRVFFETPEALSPADTNGAKECKPVGSALQANRGLLACLDVYEWEAPGEGSCEAGGPGYSPLDEGCLYLISTGKSDWASLIADASANGKDVFFFTRQAGLVGQDKDELLDVYDARVEGGIASQNPPEPPPPCESVEACRPHEYPPEAEETPASATFAGPPNPKPKHAKAKKRHHRKHRHHHRKKKRKRGHRAKHRAHAKRGVGR